MFHNEQTRTAVFAASWDIASRLVAIDPESRLFEYHPHQTLYDMLAVGRMGLHVDINRNGSIHLQKGVSDGPVMNFLAPEQWQPHHHQALPPHEVVARIAEAARLNPDAAPSTRSWPLTYRVIARALAGKVFDDALWDCRVQLYDGDTQFPLQDPAQFWPDTVDAAFVPATELWALTRNGKPVAMFWNGWCWTSSQERINLVARWARGASVDELAAEVSLRRPKKSAPALPGPPPPKKIVRPASAPPMF